MRKPIFFADLDGSLADFDGQMREDFLKICSPAERECFLENRESIRELEDKYPHIKERTRLIKRQVNWWINLKPLRLGVFTLKMAHDLGYECHILTHGPCKIASAWTEKLLWVQKNLPFEIHGNRVHVVSDKGLMHGDVLYDDYPDYCLSWLKTNPHGQVIMPTALDNKDFTHEKVLKITDDSKGLASATSVLGKRLEKIGV